MAIPSFFKQNKPRGFNYVPRHYDPVKEEREARRRAMGLDDGNGLSAGSAGQEAQSREDKEYHPTITRGSMRNYFHYKKERVDRHNMIRLIVIILVLVLATYIYLRF